jgi:hypothetical protein
MALPPKEYLLGSILKSAIPWAYRREPAREAMVAYALDKLSLFKVD